MARPVKGTLFQYLAEGNITWFGLVISETRVFWLNPHFFGRPYFYIAGLGDIHLTDPEVTVFSRAEK